MFKPSFFNYLFLYIAYLLVGCANPIAPEGGPKDVDPPKLDSLHSTRNFQTHFKKQDIVLAFDEWVELKDVFTQVIISPPLVKRPEIVRRKKTIQVLFDKDEVLRDSATYVINFGQAIRDLTEGNVNPIIFVFSTGDYIDSLSVEGKIVDAWTEKPLEKILFMLYENLADSVVHTERPFYFALTDKEGNFKVSNMKSGNFRGVALNDLNLNFRFDSDAEQVGFLDSVLALGKLFVVDTAVVKLDSVQQNSLPLGSLHKDSLAVILDSLHNIKPRLTSVPIFNIRLFTEEKPLFLRSKDLSKYGQATLGFNQPPNAAKLSFDSIGQVVFVENEKDSLRLWYHYPVQDTTWRIFVQRDTFVDTVLVKSGLRAAFMANTKLSTAAKQNGLPLKLAPEQSASILFNHPLVGFNTANILLLEDTSKTVVQPRIAIDSIQKRSLKLDYPWKEGITYELQILSGGVTDMFGLSNTDSITQKIIAGSRKDFGSLTLKATNLDSTKAYVIHLLENPDSPPLKIWTVSNAMDFEVKLNLLPPAAYTVELIEDLDRNGRWTTGSYDQHRQPERVVRKTLEQLRANWELEADVRF